MKISTEHDETAGRFKISVAGTVKDTPEEVKTSFCQALDGVFAKGVVVMKPPPVAGPTQRLIGCVIGICRDSGFDPTKGDPTLKKICKARFNKEHPNDLSGAQVSDLTDMLRTQEPGKGPNGGRLRPTSDLLDPSIVSTEQLVEEGKNLRNEQARFPD